MIVFANGDIAVSGHMSFESTFFASVCDKSGANDSSARLVRPDMMRCVILSGKSSISADRTEGCFVGDRTRVHVRDEFFGRDGFEVIGNGANIFGKIGENVKVIRRFESRVEKSFGVFVERVFSDVDGVHE